MWYVRTAWLHSGLNTQVTTVWYVIETAAGSKKWLSVQLNCNSLVCERITTRTSSRQRNLYCLSRHDCRVSLLGLLAKIMESVYRPLSAHVRFHSSKTVEEVFKYLKEVDVSVSKHLNAVQSLPGRAFDVTFKSEELKRKLLPNLLKMPDAIASSYVNRTKIVTVLFVPVELDNGIVRTILGRFGKVDGGWYQRHRDYPDLLNGTRQFRMVLEKNIPSSLRICGRNCWIRYTGQERTCLKCGDTGHMASACDQVRCFNCRQLGHVSSRCREVPVCETCGKSGHRYWDCDVSFANKVRKPSETEVEKEVTPVEVPEVTPDEVPDVTPVEVPEVTPVEVLEVTPVEVHDDAHVDVLEDAPVEVSVVGAVGEEDCMRSPDTPVQEGHVFEVEAVVEAVPEAMDTRLPDRLTDSDVSMFPDSPVHDGEVLAGLEASPEAVGPLEVSGVRALGSLFVTSDEEDEEFWTAVKRRKREVARSPPGSTRGRVRSRSRDSGNAKALVDRARGIVRESHIFREGDTWYTCDVEGCTVGFRRYDEFRRHVESVHTGIGVERVPCPMRQCTVTCNRPTDWANHLASSHPRFVLYHDTAYFDSYFIQDI